MTEGGWSASGRSRSSRLPSALRGSPLSVAIELAVPRAHRGRWAAPSWEEGDAGTRRSVRNCGRHFCHGGRL